MQVIEALDLAGKKLYQPIEVDDSNITFFCFLDLLVEGAHPGKKIFGGSAKPRTDRGTKRTKESLDRVFCKN